MDSKRNSIELPVQTGYQTPLRAAFPGSFDPPTLGHMNIIRRCARFFDEVTVVVAENRNKQSLFSAEERLELLTRLVEPWKNVSAALCTGLVVDFLRKKKIPVLVRGVRGSDFSYEYELSLMNRTLDPEIETVFLPADPGYGALRSSAVKELAFFGGDLSAMVPPEAAQALKAKFSRTGRE